MPELYEGITGINLEALYVRKTVEVRFEIDFVFNKPSFFQICALYMRGTHMIFFNLRGSQL
jgi:hypothetical protein